MSKTVNEAAMSQLQSELLRRVERRLMAPCCYTQTIDLHMSEIAETMRHEVAAMVLAGKAETEIYGHYKAIYGEQILAVPDGALGFAAFAIPSAVSTLATGALVYVLYRFHKRKTVLAPINAAASSSDPCDGANLLSEDARAVRDRIRAETAW